MFASHLTIKLVCKSIYLQKKYFTDSIYIDFVSIRTQRLDLTAYNGSREEGQKLANSGRLQKAMKCKVTSTKTEQTPKQKFSLFLMKDKI